ncbi:alpha/beta hydrolase [Natronospirillum operosum]|uniref:Alpha/beta hydrolase n=1 Tax=Natronospirillum operosum TaxID=2759953 RepID=A0A4Z0W5K3_9GAMM|nr:alpha/beta hydrolase [Natronospirillum operosum]TGG91274.1 alpha/beta hydrolase [Natronospirillum operosum]
MSLLPCVEINPASTATHTVIWLHGLGASGHDFEPIVPELGLPDDLAVRFLFPHAPNLPVTVNGGVSMPAWYDILEMQIERKVDTEQLRASAAQIRALIQRERDNGIAPERILIAGFSQGGAVAYEVALSYPERLAGLLALSTYFATADSIQWSPANQDLPVLIQHGTQDPIVPEALGQQSYQQLQARGLPVDYQTFVMPHAVCPEQIGVIGRWLTERLS